MFPRSSTPPTGPRGSSSARRGTGRGGIQKRRAGPPKVDKDGDLVMSQEEGGEAKGRSGGHSEGGRSSRGRAAGREGQGAGTARGSLSAQQTRQAVIRGLESLQTNTPELRISHDARLRVRGLTESKAASNPDGGLKDLLSFLERKATGLDVEHHRIVRIKKACLIL